MEASRIGRASEHEYFVNATTQSPGESSRTGVLEWIAPARGSPAGEDLRSLNGIAVA
jgi:hypothetical protein